MLLVFWCVWCVWRESAVRVLGVSSLVRERAIGGESRGRAQCEKVVSAMGVSSLAAAADRVCVLLFTSAVVLT